MNDTKKETTRYGFLLLPNYSMIAFSSAIEVLRMANRLSKEKLYEWPCYTMTGELVPASNGLMVEPTEHIKNACGLAVLFVCSGVRVEQVWSDALKSCLHQFKQKGVTLGGLCTGTHLLANVLDEIPRHLLAVSGVYSDAVAEYEHQALAHLV